MSPYKSLAAPDDIKADAAQKRRFSVQLLDQDLGTGKARVCWGFVLGGRRVMCVGAWIENTDSTPHEVSSLAYFFLCVRLTTKGTSGKMPSGELALKLMDAVQILQMMVGPFRKDITVAQKRKKQSGTYTMFPSNSTELEVPFWRALASVFDSPELRLAFLSKFQAVLDMRLEKYDLGHSLWSLSRCPNPNSSRRLA
jgi:hypothetical protein